MKRAGVSESEWSQITIDGAKIEDLCLTFVVPGVDSMELVKGGSDVAVTAVNLREYVDTVIDACVGSGVAAYFESVRAGLEEVFPLARLKMFSESELDAIICGEGERWTPEMLTECITFDHGYNTHLRPSRTFATSSVASTAINSARSCASLPELPGFLQEAWPLSNLDSRWCANSRHRRLDWVPILLP